MKQLYIFLFFLLSGVTYASGIFPPTASITVSDNNICIGGTATVVFSGTGIGNHTFTYQINTGPVQTVAVTGNTATMLVSSAVAGSFTYTLLTVKDQSPDPQQPVNQNVVVTVNPEPVVSFSSNANSNTCSGTVVQFNSTVSTGTGSYTYEWDFGDGFISTLADPSHAFTALGCATQTFNVSLKVTDSNGCESAVFSQNIIVKQAPNFELADQDIFSPFSNCENSPSISNPNFTLILNKSMTAACITGYEIDWGDSTTESLTDASFPIAHTYTQLGAFTILVTATSSNGCQNTKIYQVANQSNPAGSLGTLGSTTGLCAPAVVPFTISNWELNSPGTTYVLSFGDGESVTLTHPLAQSTINHTYTTTSCPEPSYTATLQVINLCDTTPFTAGNIQVRIKPDISFTSADNACVDQNVCFTNTTIAGAALGSCTSLTSYIWNFGDPSSPNNIVAANSATPTNICHVFSAPGNYTVSLSGSNPCGADSFTKNVCIEGPITPSFSTNTIEGCGPLAITTSNTTNLTGLCATPNYLWTVTYAASNCGTGPVSIPNQITANASYNFTVPGTYTITLTMTNTCGSFNTTRVVVVKQPPLVDIDSISDICEQNSITPIAQIVNCGLQPLAYSWSFPGGTPSVSSDANPGAITYASAGIKTITLTVSNECGVSEIATQTFEVKPLPVITNVSLSQTVCSGQQTTVIPLTADISGSAFSWTAVATTGITGFIPSGNSSTIPVQTIQTNQLTPGTVTYTIIPSVNGCAGPSVQYVIHVNPAPLFTTQPIASTTCFGITPPQLSVAFQGGSGTPAYQWFSNTINSTVGATPISTANTDTFQPLADATGTAFYFVTITFNGGGGCATITSDIVAVTVNPVPVIAAMATAACSGSAFVAIPANTAGNVVPAGTTYSWTVPSGAGFTGGSAQNNQASISQTLTNNTNAPVNATYMVTPKSGTCIGQPFQLTVTVNPVPLIPQQTANVCAGTEFTVIPADGGSTIVPVGTLYSWSVPTVTGGLTGGQSGTAQPDIRGTLFNPTPINRTATYTVTPVAPDGSCAGAPFTVIVTVRPTPVIASLDPIEICSGSTVFPNFSNVSPNVHPSGTTFSWALPTVSPAGSITGAITGNDAVAFIPTLTNITTEPATAVYTITPKSGSCIGADFTVSITVNPSPIVNDITSQVLCDGIQTDLVSFTGPVPGTTYNWTNNNPSIGLAASGSNDIAAFTAINNTNAPVTATITVTPVFGLCNGTAKTFTITVNPAPVVTFSIPDQIICSGETTAQVTLSSTTAGATFAWDAVIPSGLSGVSASGNATIPAQTLVNTTSAPITVAYRATGTTTVGSCPGDFSLYMITVNPVPSVTTAQSETVCGGTAFNVMPLDGGGNSIPAVTTYSWGAPSGSGFLGGSAQTGQPTISQTLTNITDTQVTATYSVIPTSGSCSGSPFNVLITLNPTPKILPQTQQICSGGSFSLNPVSALPNQIVPTATTYSWSSPVYSGTITGGISGTNETTITGTLINTGNLPGTATYTVTPQAGNCQGQAFILTVTVNPNPVITTPQQQSICSGTAFSITPAHGNGNIVPFNTVYTWSSPVISPAGSITGGSANGLGQSSISQTLTNTSNATATATYTVIPIAGVCTGNSFPVTITVNPVPTVVAVSNQELCNGANTTTINFVGTVAGTVFNWTNSNPAIGLAASGINDILSFTATNAGTAPAIGNITVTPEINGCSGAPISFTITVNPTPSVIFSQPNQTICSGATSVAVNLSSVTSNTTFSWTANVPPGVNGATTSGTNTIPAQLLTNTTGNAIVITYSAIAATMGANCPGTVSIYTITVNPVPFVNAPQQIEICSGEQPGFIPANISGNNIPAGTTFTWTAPTGAGFTGGNAQNIPQPSFNQVLINTTLNPVAAVYMIMPEFNNCPGITFQLTVTVNPKAQIASTAVTICTGATFTINPLDIAASAIPSGTTYSWSAPTVTGGITGGVSGSGSTITGTLFNPATTSQTATYTVTPISPLGNCAGIPFQVVVNVRPALIVGSAVSDYNGFEISTAGANDGFINLTTTGGSGTYTYVWSGPGGFNSVAEDISNLGPGNYSVTISDGVCDDIVLNFQIDEPLALLIQEVLASHVNLKCFGDTDGVIEVAITQASIAPFDYVIRIQGGAIIESVVDSNAVNYVFDNLAAGVYDISVTDANGTVKQLLGLTITQPANALTITNAVVSNYNGFNITCTGVNNGSIDISISGGTPAYTYVWTGPGTFSATTQDISGLAPGTYSVEVNDATGICRAFGTYVITEPLPITFTSIISSYNGYQISCFGQSNGSIDIQPSGGTGTYTYQWNGPNGFFSATQDISGLKAGTYTLVITDSNNCVNNTGTFILNEPALLNITQSHTNILCFGASTGSIDATVTGGNPIPLGPGVFGYTYSWVGPNGFTASTEDITNVPAGSYTLTVTDISACTQAITVVLTQPSEISIAVATTPITCFGADDATITVTLSGGNAPYTIVWSDFGEGLFRDNLGAGNYLITVTDASNCTKGLNINISQALLFSITPVVKQITCFGANDGSIDLNLVGGAPPISFAWTDNPNAGVVRNNLRPGTYTINIFDNQPCSISRSFTIIEPQLLVLSANVTHALDCNNANSGAINLLVSGGTPPFVYSWSSGISTEDLTNVPAGNYQVTVKDAHNCTQTAQYSINRPPPLVANVITDTDFDCETKFVKQSFIADVSGGVPPYTLSWSSGTVSGANNEIMETDQNGAVFLNVTDNSGCTTSYSFNVDIPQFGNPSFTTTSFAFSTFGIYSIVDPIQFTNTATGSYVSIAWDFGDGSVSTEENPVHSYQKEGNYVVVQTVTYPLGCVYTHTITLLVDKGYELMIPTGFTPNNDTINDVFGPLFRGMTSIRIDVYNTWGDMIYSEEGPTVKGWDGTVKGLNVENGNYYYRVSALTFYGSLITADGPFTLIK